MFIQHIAGFLYHPNDEWRLLRKERSVSFELFVLHMAGLALIPSVCLFIGTTQVGWSITGEEFYPLGVEKAISAAIDFYFVLIISAALITYAIHYMERTFGGNASMNDCLNLTTYTSLPLFLSGFSGLYPVLWFNVFVGLIAISYSLYLLYKGVAVIMEIPEERAFIFSAAIFTAGICLLIGLLVFTVLIWSSPLIH